MIMIMIKIRFLFSHSRDESLALEVRRDQEEGGGQLERL